MGLSYFSPVVKQRVKSDDSVINPAKSGVKRGVSVLPINYTVFGKRLVFTRAFWAVFRVINVVKTHRAVGATGGKLPVLPVFTSFTGFYRFYWFSGS